MNNVGDEPKEQTDLGNNSIVITASLGDIKITSDISTTEGVDTFFEQLEKMLKDAEDDYKKAIDK